MTDLFSLLAQPSPFQRDTIPFWDEPHISKQLLKAHLDPCSEGASRKPGFIDQSVAWIGAIAPASRYTALLDIGCGPGLYAERLHDAGYRVTGIDFSRRSIAYARNKAREEGRDIQYHYGDYLKMDYTEAFDLAIMIYCDFGALSQAEGATLLGLVHRALRPGGKLLLDMFSMKKFDAFTANRTWEFHENGGFWSPCPHFTIQANSRHGERLTLEQTAVVTREESRTYHIWQRYFTPGSINEEMKSAGFRMQAVHGDVTGRPLCVESETLAIVVEK